MLTDLLSLLLDTGFYVFAGLLLFRFWMQKTNANRYISLPKEFFKLTNWIVVPLRKVIPGYKGTDWASLVAYVLLCISYSAINLILKTDAISPDLLLSFMLRDGLYHAIKLITQLVSLCLLGMVILSWIQPQSKIYLILNLFCAPILNPIRRLLPQSLGIDFSPMIAIFLIQAINIIINRVYLSM